MKCREDGPESSWRVAWRTSWRRWRSKGPEVRGGAVDLADTATWLEYFEISGHKLP